LNVGMYPDPGPRVQNRHQKTLGNSRCGTWYNYSFNVHMQAASLNSTLRYSSSFLMDASSATAVTTEELDILILSV